MDGYLSMSKSKKAQKKDEIQLEGVFLQPHRGGLQDVSARLPFLAGMNNKKVSLIGLGCLGAPCALELARSGIGQLHLVDDDTVDLGTTVRWPFGSSEIGNYKVDVLERFIQENYPYTNVTKSFCNLGIAPLDPIGDSNHLEEVERVFQESDLVFDASANLNVNHLLSDLAQERQLPYLAITVTYGAWGGHIVRVRPGKTVGCWQCYRRFLDGDQTIPYAHGDPRGLVQPGGCGTPTYTGAGFDALEIAMGGVRMAASTLTENEQNGYPTTPWDVAVINLRNATGEMIPPHWQTFPLQKHPGCACVKKL
ncbi:MAG: ThiF family adenylyltransferase [Desulfobacteraceae bacterium]|nr:ThiF family adenylyltransferase [Desulfobacteraceae bacterium]